VAAIRSVNRLVGGGQQRLRDGEAEDFGVLEVDDELELEFLFDDSPILVAAGARSPWARRRRIELAELVNESWVLPPPDSLFGPLVP